MKSGTSAIRIGVIGLGRAFTLMLPTFRADERVRLVAGCDPREAARAQFARDFAAPAFDSIEALCAHADVELVYVASPHQLHAEHVIAAARAGKHVLVEKPMAITIDECERMIAAAEHAGRRIIVGHSHSFDAPILALRALIATGRFGRVRMIHALNYTDFLYRPRRPEEFDTAQGGGIVFSQGAHQIDIARSIARSPATRVRASVGRWDARRPTEGAYAALIEFADGAFASLTYSGYGRFDSDVWMNGVGELGTPKDAANYGANRRALAALSDAADEAQLKAARTYGGALWKPSAASTPPFHEHFGVFIVSCEHADLRPLPSGIEICADARRWIEPLPAPTIARKEVIDELVDAVRGRRAPLHDGRSALATLEVCLAILRSARERRDVELVHQPEEAA